MNSAGFPWSLHGFHSQRRLRPTLVGWSWTLGTRMESPPSFKSKKKAKLFVAEQSVRDKKPFKVSRSDSRRFEVFFPAAGCLFRMNIRMRKDDVFYVAKSFCPHTCDSVSPTVKKAWLRSKIAKKMA